MHLMDNWLCSNCIFVTEPYLDLCHCDSKTKTQLLWEHVQISENHESADLQLHTDLILPQYRVWTKYDLRLY